MLADPETDDAAVMRSILEHPRTAFGFLLVLVGFCFVGAGAYYSITNRQSRQDEILIEHSKLISDVKNDMTQIDRRNGDKLDRMQNDLSDLKTSIRGLDTSIRFMLREQPSGPPTPTPR